MKRGTIKLNNKIRKSIKTTEVGMPRQTKEIIREVEVVFITRCEDLNKSSTINKETTKKEIETKPLIVTTLLIEISNPKIILPSKIG